jgi:hypothetical protein
MNSSIPARRSPRFARARSASPERLEAAHTLLTLRSSPRTVRSISPPRVVMRSASPPRRRSARLSERNGAETHGAERLECRRSARLGETTNQVIVGLRRSPRIAALHESRQNDLKMQFAEFRDGLRERTDALEHASNKFRALNDVLSYATDNIGVWYFGHVNMKNVVQSVLMAMRAAVTNNSQRAKYRAANARLQDAIADMEFYREHGF